MGCRINEPFSEYEVGFSALTACNLHDKYNPLIDDIETDAEAAASNWRTCSQLARCDDPEAHRLASILQSCTESHRCGSGICARCDLASRKTLIPTGANALRLGHPLTKVRMAPRSWRNAVGTLANVNLEHFVSSQEQVLKKALPQVTMFGLAKVVLSGWDRGPGEWQLSISLIAEAADDHVLRETILKCFPDDPGWESQHHFKQIPHVNRLREVCILLEPILGGTTRACGAEDYRNAITNRAPANAALEAVLSLHRFPVHKRLLLGRLRLVDGRDGFGLIHSG